MLAVGAPVAAWCGVTLSAADLAGCAVVGAGAAMLPDVDHPSATVAQSLGPVTHTLSRVVSKLFGGHRNGTHTIPFAILVAVALSWLLADTSGPWAALGICFFFTSLVVRTLTDAHGGVCAAVSAIVAATIVAVAPGEAWIPWAVGFGCVLHLLGDVVTPEGVPILWLPGRRFPRLSFPIVGHTGDWRENAIASVAGLACCWLMATAVFLPIYQDPPAAKAQPAPAPSHKPKLPATPKRPSNHTLQAVPAGAGRMVGRLSA
jgi:membrane-bound metal-dependent hydrolase YbcI (DUF457 family)